MVARVNDATVPAAESAPKGYYVALVGEPVDGGTPTYDAGTGYHTSQVPSARGDTFTVLAHFSAAGNVVLWPEIPFACRIVGATGAFESGVTGSATFTLKSAPTIAGSFTDMIGAGAKPDISAAQSQDVNDTSGWTDRDLAAGEALELGCATLTGTTYACPQLTLQRT